MRVQWFIQRVPPVPPFSLPPPPPPVYFTSPPPLPFTLPHPSLPVYHKLPVYHNRLLVHLLRIRFHKMLLFTLKFIHFCDLYVFNSSHFNTSFRRVREYGLNDVRGGDFLIAEFAGSMAIELPSSLPPPPPLQFTPPPVYPPPPLQLTTTAIRPPPHLMAEHGVIVFWSNLV